VRHSPTPWRFGPRTSQDELIVEDANQWQVAIIKRLPERYGGSERELANIELLIHAVNANQHLLEYQAELRDRLADAVSLLEAYTDPTDRRQQSLALDGQARATIRQSRATLKMPRKGPMA
jgi:hypothetical protein